jgi:hypothetical protein
MHVHVLDAERHRRFLAEEREDPYTKETFRAGQRIVVCSGCKSAFSVESWEAFGRRCSDKACGAVATLPGLPPNPGAALRFGRRTRGSSGTRGTRTDWTRTDRNGAARTAVMRPNRQRLSVVFIATAVAMGLILGSIWSVTSIQNDGVEDDVGAEPHKEWVDERRPRESRGQADSRSQVRALNDKEPAIDEGTSDQSISANSLRLVRVADRRWMNIEGAIRQLAGAKTIAVWIVHAEQAREEVQSLLALSSEYRQEVGSEIPKLEAAHKVSVTLDSRLITARRMRARGCDRMPLVHDQVSRLGYVAPDSAVALEIARCGVVKSRAFDEEYLPLGPLGRSALRDALQEPWMPIGLP